jgi:hypothetical protein
VSEDELVEGGMPEEEAHLFLLPEEEWSPDMEGVELLPYAPDAIVEAEQISLASVTSSRCDTHTIRR